MPFESQMDRIAALKADNPQNIALQSFDPAYFVTLSEPDQARLMACLRSGVDNPDSEMGCYACQPADYDDFRSFFARVLARYHKVDEDARHLNDWSLDGVEGLPESGILDLAALGLPALSMRVRVGRNLADFPLPGAMTRDDRVTLETRMMTAFDALIADPDYGGAYHSLTPGHPNQIDQATYQALVDDHIMFKDMSNDRYLTAAGIAADWPFGRGCYVSQDRGFIIWVGEEDHLRIMCMERGTILNRVFERLKTALDKVSGFDGLTFAMSPDIGVVTSCPTNAGTGMRASVHIPLPRLTADGTDRKAKEICRPLGLSVRGAGGEHTPIGADGTVDISPSARFCITEAEIIAALYQGLAKLQTQEAQS
ncbi:phosphagen kinase [Aliiroseovarius subalbicans]|uniref:phosphagen kinase n=1 Tax=Aliiroseovarius subalbicans TaxID=2925840 RepID=UPI001F5AA86C|nr:phosphagen kinase [Aliiroseovarius subalbicans]MCI2399429.1 phosphagen kinase [Aliiroseovarius subalbicans]